MRQESTGYLGVKLSDIDADRAKALKLGEERGVEIKIVMEGSPADKAGIQPGRCSAELQRRNDTRRGTIVAVSAGNTAGAAREGAVLAGRQDASHDGVCRRGAKFQSESVSGFSAAQLATLHGYSDASSPLAQLGCGD